MRGDDLRDDGEPQPGPAVRSRTGVVEVYVGYLRRKIDAPFGTASIETLRGVGYRMADPTPA